jgi:photosystem I subunit 8
MAAAFLPSILVPLVGLIFPAFSMALFFLYVSTDDIAEN